MNQLYHDFLQLFLGRCAYVTFCVCLHSVGAPASMWLGLPLQAMFHCVQDLRARATRKREEKQFQSVLFGCNACYKTRGVVKHTNTCHVLSVCTERGMHHCSFDTKKALLCRPALNLLCYSIRQLCSYPPFLPTAFRWFCNSPLPPTPSDRNVLLMFPCSKCVHSQRNPWHMHHCSFVSSQKVLLCKPAWNFSTIHTRINSVAPIPLLLSQLQVVLLFTTTPYTKRQERAACVPMF